MNVPVVFRSYLYVPASEPRRIDKALAGAADAVVLDLEDAVAPDAKAAARANAAAVVGERPKKPTFVRVNGFATGMTHDDVDAVAGPGLAGIRIPKCEQAADVRTVVRWLGDRGCAAGVVPLLESALGVEHSFVLATADEAVVGLAMGEADLRADLGVTDDAGLDFSRARCVAAARAAGRPGPVQSVHTRLDDEAGLRASSRRGRAWGFTGRSAIHPSQVPVIHEAFTPTDEEQARAEALVAAYEAGRARGEVAVVTAGGQFVDEPVASAAYAVLALAQLADPPPAG